jgi:hypothetical protein
MGIMLTQDEIDLFRLLLSQSVIRKPTGKLGILHGMDWFVSPTNPIYFKKYEIIMLDNLVKKFGLNEIKMID